MMGFEQTRRSKWRIAAWVAAILFGLLFIYLNFLVFGSCPSRPDDPITTPEPIESSDEASDEVVDQNTTTGTSITTTTSSTTTTTMSTTSTITNKTQAGQAGDWAPIDLDPICQPLDQELVNATLLWLDQGARLGQPEENVSKMRRAGCVCEEEGQRGLWAWMAVPTEQISNTWCDFGQWGPICGGLFLYACHGLTLSLVAERATKFSDKERQKAYKRKVQAVKKDLKAGRKSSKNFLDAKKERKIVLWHGSPQDPIPQPIGQVRITETEEHRVFKV